MSRVSLWLLVIAFSLFAQIAHAESVAEKFGKAVDLFVDGKCDKALPMFREVHAATESPNARLYIARCLLKGGDLADAYNEMKGTVNDASERASKEPKYAETRDAAAAELAVLEPKVARIVVAVADPPEGVTAEVGGKDVPIGIPWGVAAGTVTIVVRAPGKEDVTREAEIEAGKTKTVAVTFADDKKPDTQSDSDPDADADGGPGFFTGVRIAGLVIAVLGVGGVVAFAVTGSKAKSEYDDLVTLCNDTTCPQSEAERVADGRTLTTVANVSLAVGGVALLVGTAMIIFGGPSDDATAEAGLQVRPLLGPGYLGAHGTF